MEKFFCMHFNECNGCFYKGVEYAQQLKEKKIFLEELFTGLWSKSIEVFESPMKTFYRNKIELSFSGNKLGFKRKDNPKTAFSLKQCFLAGENSLRVIPIIRKWLLKHGVQGYDSWENKGDFKTLVLRESKYSGQVMVGITTFSEKLEREIEELALTLLKNKRVVSVHWLVNSNTNDSFVGETKKVFGKNFLREKFLDCFFDFGLKDFFQPNPLCAGIAVKKILDNLTGQNVLDVFCGIGSISLNAAKRVKKITGFELNESAVKLARHNAEINSIRNARFVSGKARVLLKFFNEKIDSVIVDPPRQGMSKKEVLRVSSLNPKKIFYLSCNPVTLKENIKCFIDQGFEVELVQGFDFFPFTRHVECLSVLTNQK